MQKWACTDVDGGAHATYTFVGSKTEAKSKNWATADGTLKASTTTSVDGRVVWLEVRFKKVPVMHSEFPC